MNTPAGAATPASASVSTSVSVSVSVRDVGPRERFRRDGELDVVRLRHGAGRGRRAVAQHREIVLEDAGQPGAVLGLELCEAVDVGEQRVAAPGEVDHFLFETFAFVVAAALGFGLRVREQLVRLELGFLHHLARLLLRFGDRFVGGALCEQQRAVEDVFGLPAAIGFQLRRLQPLRHLVDARVARVDARRGALEEVVDDLSVVAAERLGDLGVSEFSRSNFHAEKSNPGRWKRRVCTTSVRSTVAASVTRPRLIVRRCADFRNRRCRAGSPDR